jgi:hypothetical protein
MMDSGFVGLIYSVFSGDQWVLHAFQAIFGSSDPSIPGDSSSADGFPVENVSIQDGNGVQFVEVNIPIEVRRGKGTAKEGIFPFTKWVEMERLMIDEEIQAYEASSKGSSSMQKLYNAAVFQKCVSSIVECNVGPLLAVLETRDMYLTKHIATLEREKDAIKKDLDESTEECETKPHVDARDDDGRDGDGRDGDARDGDARDDRVSDDDDDRVSDDDGDDRVSVDGVDGVDEEDGKEDADK